KIRTALCVDRTPALALELVDKLVHEPRLSDAGIANQERRPPARPGILSQLPEQPGLVHAVDKPCNASRPAYPPTGDIGSAGHTVDRHRLAESFESLATQIVE